MDSVRAESSPPVSVESIFNLDFSSNQQTKDRSFIFHKRSIDDDDVLLLQWHSYKYVSWDVCGMTLGLKGGKVRVKTSKKIEKDSTSLENISVVYHFIYAFGPGLPAGPRCPYAFRPYAWFDCRKWRKRNSQPNGRPLMRSNLTHTWWPMSVSSISCVKSRG